MQAARLHITCNGCRRIHAPQKKMALYLIQSSYEIYVHKLKTIATNRVLDVAGNIAW